MINNNIQVAIIVNGIVDEIVNFVGNENKNGIRIYRHNPYQVDKFDTKKDKIIDYFLTNGTNISINSVDSTLFNITYEIALDHISNNTKSISSTTMYELTTDQIMITQYMIAVGLMEQVMIKTYSHQKQYVGKTIHFPYLAHLAHLTHLANHEMDGMYVITRSVNLNPERLIIKMIGSKIVSIDSVIEKTKTSNSFELVDIEQNRKKIENMAIETYESIMSLIKARDAKLIIDNELVDKMLKDVYDTGSPLTDSHKNRIRYILTGLIGRHKKILLDCLEYVYRIDMNEYRRFFLMSLLDFIKYEYKKEHVIGRDPETEKYMKITLQLPDNLNYHRMSVFQVEGLCSDDMSNDQMIDLLNNLITIYPN
jgi:hypothetical protein